jgi:hypothetical protein
MADEEQIRKRIAGIADRRNNTTIDDIQLVVNQLQQWHSIGSRPARHGVLFRAGTRRFMVNCHNPGSKQVKPYSVDDFLDAMIELGWYEG